MKRISGIMRLQFTRRPYTHWSLSFIGDPEIEFGIESQFQGRQMQSHITSLISNQIRKAIRRKHTLPNYKLRYKPFFNHHAEEEDSDVIPDGTLEVHILQAARLMMPTKMTIGRIYCTVTLSRIPWITAKKGVEENTVVISLLVEIHKTKNQQIGIVFKQLEDSVIIEAILPNTPAAKSNLRKDDTLYSVEGKPVSHINQVAKLLKGISKPMFLLRIERIISGQIQTDRVNSTTTDPPDSVDNSGRDKESSENLGIAFSKANDSVQVLKAKDEGTTPGSSPRKSGLLSRNKSRSLTRNDSEGDGSTATINNVDKSESPAKKGVPRVGSMESVREESVFTQHVSKDYTFNSLIHLADNSSLTLDDCSKYLNINVMGITTDGREDVLLGYSNIPIGNILTECSESNLRNFLKDFSLQPPDCPSRLVY